MEYWRTVLLLLRRRSVALPVLLFSVFVASATYFAMPTHYVSTATIVLATPANGGTLGQDPTRPLPKINPLRNFDGMRTAASILIQVLSTPDVANQLGAPQGGSTSFTVNDGSRIPQLLGSNGPFIVVESDSTSAVLARDIIVRVEQRLRDELINEQQLLRAPPSTFIGMFDVVSPTVPEVHKTTRWEAAAGALALGLIASTSVAYFAYWRRGIIVRDLPTSDTVGAGDDQEPTIVAAPRTSVRSDAHST
jgi:hypothetical protein